MNSIVLLQLHYHGNTQSFSVCSMYLFLKLPVYLNNPIIHLFIKMKSLFLYPLFFLFVTASMDKLEMMKRILKFHNQPLVKQPSVILSDNALPLSSIILSFSYRMWNVSDLLERW